MLPCRVGCLVLNRIAQFGLGQTVKKQLKRRYGILHLTTSTLVMSKGLYQVLEINEFEVKTLIRCAAEIHPYESHIDNASAACLLTELTGVQIPAVRDEWSGILASGDIVLNIRLVNLESSSLDKLEDYRFFRIDYYEGAEEINPLLPSTPEQRHQS